MGSISETSPSLGVFTMDFSFSVHFQKDLGGDGEKLSSLSKQFLGRENGVWGISAPGQVSTSWAEALPSHKKMDEVLAHRLCRS